MNAHPMRAAATALCLCGLGALAARAVTFSVDLASPTGGVGFGEDLYNDPAALLVLPGGGVPGLEVDAMSYYKQGPPIPEIYFSVTRGSLGLGGTAVNNESMFSDEPADVFFTTLNFTNTLAWDGNGVPTPPGAFAPPLGLIEPWVVPGDNLDALDLNSNPVYAPQFGMAPIFWSVDAATVGGGMFPQYGGMSGADVFMAPAAPGYSMMPGLPYAAAPILGLQWNDDIDAMVWLEDGVPAATAGDLMLFSLTPNSPTLGMIGATPADILITAPNAGLPGIFAPAQALGLQPGDDLDALDIVPETGELLLLGLAALGCMLLRRRDASL